MIDINSNQVGSSQLSQPAMLHLRGVTVPMPVFIKRLRRLLVLRYQAAQYLDAQDIHLLDRCIFATYCDCRDLGAGPEALRLLEEARSGNGPWTLRRGGSTSRA